MPAGPTYEPIATNTLGSTASQYTFSSIPGTYTDLVLVVSWGRTSGVPEMTLRFNGDAGSNYSVTTLEGAGATAVSQRQSNASQMYVAGFQGASYTSPYTNIINLNNYFNTTTFKTVLSRNSANSTGCYLGLWRNTSAITSITLDAVGNTFIAGSTFTLYGIKAA